MKYLKFVYLLFAALELLGGFMARNATADTLFERFGGRYIEPEAMGVFTGFSNALIAIAIISVFGFFVKERIAKLGLSLGFAFYNVMAAINCFNALIAKETYLVPGVLHTIFGVLFIMMAVLAYKDK